MTQLSRPNQGNVITTPAYHDAGPYTRDEWAEKLIIEWVGDDVDVKGPFARYDNRLEVTNPAGVTIRVNSGAGYTGGTMLISDAVVSFTPSTPAANPRIDRVVMVLNNTNAVYSTNLEFPTVLADYDGLSSVPPYCARLAILTGAEAAAPVPRALVQNANYWMIELARYEISTVPVVSDLTDYRDYVDTEDKIVWVEPIFAYNNTDSVAIAISRGGQPGLPPAMYVTPDNKLSELHGRLVIPTDYIEGGTFTAVFLPAAALVGNIYISTSVTGGQCAEAYDSWTTACLAAAEATNGVQDAFDCHLPCEISASAEAEDIVHVFTYRRADNVLDTINADYQFIGWLFEYIGLR